MAKLRMNDEYRKKIINRYIDHAEKEDTLERQAYDTCKEEVKENYATVFAKAKEVVQRSYPTEHCADLNHYKQIYGNAVDVVAKDKCFYFSMAQGLDLDEHSDFGNNRTLSEHIDFGLYGSNREPRLWK